MMRSGTKDDALAVMKRFGLETASSVSAYLNTNGIVCDPFYGPDESPCAVALRDCAGLVLGEGRAAEMDDAYLQAIADLLKRHGEDFGGVAVGLGGPSPDRTIASSFPSPRPEPAISAAC